MSNLIYITNMSLDGYIEDQNGDFNWVDPDQVFQYITNLVRPIATYLYGRRLYETMAYWGSPIESYPVERRDFARIWQRAEKIVFSRTLTAATTPNTRVEKDFNTEAIRNLKHESSDDISIGGADLAGLAFEADLVDECQLFVHPVVAGGGKAAFSPGLRRNFELIQMTRVGTNVIHLDHRARREEAQS